MDAAGPVPRRTRRRCAVTFPIRGPADSGRPGIGQFSRRHPGGGRDGMPVIGVDGVSHQGMHGRGLRVPLGGFLGVLSPSATARRGPPFGLAGTPICRSRWSRGDCEGCLPRIVVTRAVCRFRRWFRVALAGGDPQQSCARPFARRQSFDEGVEDRKAWAYRLRREQRLKSGIVTTSSAGTPSGQPGQDVH